MSFFTKKKICVTHNGAFHADDLFATVALSILNNGNIKIVRTRDPKVIITGDYVYDVGGENDPERNKFDHHQKGGAGVRENGIPYAAFGLVWKKYGEQISGNKEVADHIEKKIVCFIDAKDVGFDLFKPLIKDVYPYSADSIFLSEYPTWKESNDGIDIIFKKQVDKVTTLLKREIKIASDDIEGINKLTEYYNLSTDKRIVIAESDFPRYLLQDTLSKFPEPVYLIYPSSKSDTWKVEAIKKSPETMESRKPFPESWRGFLNGDSKAEEVIGVSGIIFTHPTGFYAQVKTKEDAIKLAEKALLA
ncbi:MYG1 family protein [Candidatus Nomurabacteria bacterium]|nr:MYG1 family protein [Candidatus Nomurabacteria bacterium]